MQYSTRGVFANQIRAGSRLVCGYICTAHIEDLYRPQQSALGLVELCSAYLYKLLNQ